MNRAKHISSDSHTGLGLSARAVEQRAGIRQAFASLLRSHYRNSQSSFAKLVREPVQSLMTVLVIAIALALPAALYVAVDSMQGLSGGWHDSARISVFLDQQLNEPDIQALRATLEARPHITDVTYLSPRQALTEFQQASGFGDVLKLLDVNPLPAVLLLALEAGWSNTADNVTALVDELKNLPGVDDVLLDMQWLRRMQQLLDMGRRITALLGFTLALGVLLVVGNTIRLAIESRRDEIVVVKLVGGTNGFVRRPFLYTGIWYGLLGGLTAGLGIILATWWLNASILRLAELYQSNFTLASLGLTGVVALALIGAALGLFGATLAVGRHIARIEPR